MLIPFEQLAPDTLTRLIEDFVTRDGTDNGDETPLQVRIDRVRRALDKNRQSLFSMLKVNSVSCVYVRMCQKNGWTICNN